MVVDSVGKILLECNYFIISDTHFFDENIVTVRDRKNNFNSVEQMNSVLIKNWNSVISDDDIVIHLGDVYNSDKVPYNNLKDLLFQLNGRIFLALGNNDNHYYLNKSGRFESIHLWMRDYYHNLILSHAPLSEMAFKCYGDHYINIHGHTHGMGSPYGDYINVSADVTKFSPVSVKSLLKSDF